MAEVSAFLVHVLTHDLANVHLAGVLLLGMAVPALAMGSRLRGGRWSAAFRVVAAADLLWIALVAGSATRSASQGFSAGPAPEGFTFRHGFGEGLDLFWSLGLAVMHPVVVLATVGSVAVILDALWPALLRPAFLSVPLPRSGPVHLPALAATWVGLCGVHRVVGLAEGGAAAHACFLIWAAVLWGRRRGTDPLDGVLLVLVVATWLEVTAGIVMAGSFDFGHWPLRGGHVEVLRRFARHHQESSMLRALAPFTLAPVVALAALAACGPRDRLVAALVAAAAIASMLTTWPGPMLQYEMLLRIVGAHRSQADVEPPPALVEPVRP